MQLLDMNETSRSLRISPQTVRRIVKAGELPVVRIGDRVLFREEDVQALIERRLESTTTARAETSP